MKNKKNLFIVYAINYYNMKDIEVHYTTTSEERAKELFYQNYDKDYEIIKVLS